MQPSADVDPWGMTTLELFERLEEALKSEQQWILATVVAVEGSAYRRPGAKMLFGPDGSAFGGITAGCLEGPLADVAGEVRRSNEPELVTFDLTSDDGWGLGLGCEGIVDILVEPVTDSWREPVDASHRGEPVALATAIDETASVPLGARATVTEDGTQIEPDDGPSLPAAVLESVSRRAGELAASGRSETISVAMAGESVEVFVDGIEPINRLLIFGGQPDSRPLSRLAREVGLRVTVATARGGQADPDAFPNADRVVATHPTDIDELVDDRTSVVIMTHNLLDDRLALEVLLGTDVPYIGLMGPRERFQRIREELEAEGIALTETDRERLATPVGLDLGGGEPIEIALSIVSEIVAASNDRDGGRLRDREGPIHDRVQPSPE